MERMSNQNSLNTQPPARPATGNEQNQGATIGKSLVIKGEVSGSESLYIDGRIEGSINLPGNRVTVGRNGHVAAVVTAREVVVEGKVIGNVNAADRLHVRSEASLTGDVSAQRISIEDGAFFKGQIDIRTSNEPVEKAHPRSGARENELPQNGDSRKLDYVTAG
jgi:cytoskeletal protein CcmA (bactofilin family)